MDNKESYLTRKIKKYHVDRVSQLAQQYGLLTPNLLVKDATKTNSPLHSYFEWNQGRAAHLYRLQQARGLINYVTIKVSGGDSIKAFVNVNLKTQNGVRSAYVTVQRALSDSDLRKQVLADALSEIRYWRQRYSELQELSKIFKIVDKKLESHKTK